MASLPRPTKTKADTSRHPLPDLDRAGDPLQGYLSRPALARRLGKSERTIQRWDNLREGPPVVHVGKTAYYRELAVREWLLNRERQQIRSNR